MKWNYKAIGEKIINRIFGDAEMKDMLIRGCDAHSDDFDRFSKDYKEWQGEVFI